MNADDYLYAVQALDFWINSGTHPDNRAAKLREVRARFWKAHQRREKNRGAFQAGPPRRGPGKPQQAEARN